MEQNNELRIAWDFVEHTGRSIFLTGKAGTGKTTFLKAVVGHHHPQESGTDLRTGHHRWLSRRFLLQQMSQKTFTIADYLRQKQHSLLNAMDTDDPKRNGGKGSTKGRKKDRKK